MNSQLALYVHHYEKNNLPTPRPNTSFRQLWVLISKSYQNWKSHLIIVKPETVIKWHRTAFKWFWKRKSQKVGRPRLSEEWISTIKRVHKENPLLSPEKLHEQLALLGLKDIPAPNTIAKYLPDTRESPSRKQIASWRTFLHNHKSDTWAMDFLTVPTLKMDVLYVFIIIQHKTRRIIQFGVTKNPNMD
ncbi:hypothetical protein [Pontibacillus yanchengensis]|uniref:hypothetical protein n=1 Tax=Pontibacillus yanchengensis TaxID=462910 RepID=UPI00192A0895|nr:hypothetical protein [Pontibacillus yanchengensis]